MDKKEVAAFFDRLAPHWEEHSRPEGAVLEKILDLARLAPGEDVLDVACGIGVMFPHYLARGAASVTGIDLSREMIRRAEAIYADHPRVRVVWGDAETADLKRTFDAAVIHNALPHFDDPRALLAAMARFVRPGGRLTVAHSAGREAINACHHGAERVSRGLMPAEELAELFAPWFTVETLVDDESMYLVTGVRNEPVDNPA